MAPLANNLKSQEPPVEVNNNELTMRLSSRQRYAHRRRKLKIQRLRKRGR